MAPTIPRSSSAVEEVAAEAAARTNPLSRELVPTHLWSHFCALQALPGLARARLALGAESLFL